MLRNISGKDELKEEKYSPEEIEFIKNIFDTDSKVSFPANLTISSIQHHKTDTPFQLGRWFLGHVIGMINRITFIKDKNLKEKYLSLEITLLMEELRKVYEALYQKPFNSSLALNLQQTLFALIKEENEKHADDIEENKKRLWLLLAINDGLSLNQLTKNQEIERKRFVISLNQIKHDDNQAINEAVKNFDKFSKESFANYKKITTSSPGSDVGAFAWAYKGEILSLVALFAIADWLAFIFLVSFFYVDLARVTRVLNTEHEKKFADRLESNLRKSSELTNDDRVAFSNASQSTQAFISAQLENNIICKKYAKKMLFTQQANHILTSSKVEIHHDDTGDLTVQKQQNMKKLYKKEKPKKPKISDEKKPVKPKKRNIPDQEQKEEPLVYQLSSEQNEIGNLATAGPRLAFFEYGNFKNEIIGLLKRNNKDPNEVLVGGLIGPSAEFGGFKPLEPTINKNWSLKFFGTARVQYAPVKEGEKYIDIMDNRGKTRPVRRYYACLYDDNNK